MAAHRHLLGDPARDRLQVRGAADQAAFVPVVVTEPEPKSGGFVLVGSANDPRKNTK
jgi:hypothetical protein